MALALLGLGVFSLLEMLLWLGPIWSLRKLAAPTVLSLLALDSLVLLGVNPALWTALLAVFSFYRCLNLSRVVAGRNHADYLFHASRKTSFWLIGSQLLIAAAAEAGRHYGFSAEAWWTAAECFSLGAAIIILGSTLRHVRTTRPPKLTLHVADAELPTLTVAIPARNETTDLEECLQSLLSSTYPKLEILVLDDCSQDKRTSEIIRGFAHGGVRFIAGKEPPESWLAKNYAYDQLADEANGELLLFCGVDTRFQPGSLDALVKTLLQKRKSMLSVMPRNTAPGPLSLAGWVMQPNRYAWELALPRRLLKRPPVLSTCWMITRQALEAAGGFEAVRRKGVPESYLARSTASVDDGYSFIHSGAGIGITSHKAPGEQRATTIRTRYLQMHRRPEMAALASLAELGVLVTPLVLLINQLLNDQWPTAGLAAVAFLTNTVAYSRIFNLAYRRFLVKGLFLLPIAALYDVKLLNYSMWQYEFGEVIWKGRNVCIPVMRVVPKLPGS